MIRLVGVALLFAFAGAVDDFHPSTEPGCDIKLWPTETAALVPGFALEVVVDGCPPLAGDGPNLLLTADVKDGQQLRLTADDSGKGGVTVMCNREIRDGEVFNVKLNAQTSCSTDSCKKALMSPYGHSDAVKKAMDGEDEQLVVQTPAEAPEIKCDKGCLYIFYGVLVLLSCVAMSLFIGKRRNQDNADTTTTTTSKKEKPKKSMKKTDTKKSKKTKKEKTAKTAKSSKSKASKKQKSSKAQPSTALPLGSNDTPSKIDDKSRYVTCDEPARN